MQRKLGRFECVAIVLGMMQAHAAFAFPQLGTMILWSAKGTPLHNSEAASGKVNWQTLTAKGNEKYNGVGSIVFYPSTPSDHGQGCSASLIDAGGDKDAPLYALTAAHCLLSISAPEKQTSIDYLPSDADLVRTDYAVSDTSFMTVRRFSDNQDEWLKIKVAKVAYFNYQGNDLAVVELDATRGWRIEQGLPAYKISRKAVTSLVQRRVELVGVPLEGLDWLTQPLVRSTCSTLGLQLNSGNARETRLLHRCSGIGGLSGSPIFDAKSGEIAAVDSNSAFYDKISQVFPDELLQSDPLLLPQNAGSPARPLAACFDASGKFDLDASGCTIQKPCDGLSDAMACARANCERGNGRACLDAALLDGKVNETTQQLVERGCEAGDPASCYGVLSILTTSVISAGPDAANSQARLLKFAPQACDIGVAEACAAQGVLLVQDGKFAPAISAYTKGCLESSAKSCTQAALLIGQDSGSTTKALKHLLAEACLLDSTQCELAGKYFALGLHMSVGLKLLDFGCTSNDGKSCYALSGIYASSHPELGNPTPNQPKADEYSAKACQLGVKEACPGEKNAGT